VDPLGIPDQTSLLGFAMTTLTVMLSIWGLMVVAFIALMVYRGHLTQYETDQLFLNETTPSSFHQENDAVIRRVKMIQPICTGVGMLALLMTVAVAGVWIVQIMHQF
jgi:hypothetical protein